MFDHGMRLLAASLMAVSVACDQPDSAGRWQGTSRDSAGVTVVSNPSEGTRQGPAALITEELRIGEADATPEYQFGQIADLDVDRSGNIYVLDQFAHEVRVFDSSGNHIRTLGRAGTGPGELSRNATNVLVGPGDTVTIIDAGLQRASRFAPSGEFVASFPLTLAGMSVGWDRAGDFLYQQVRPLPDAEAATGEPAGDLIIARTWEGTIVDTLVRFPAGGSVQVTPQGPRYTFFAPEPLWHVTEDGRLLTATSDQLRIEVRSLEGRVQEVITKVTVPLPLGEKDRAAFLSMLRDGFERQQVPPALVQRVLNNVAFTETYPAMTDVIGGSDGTIWTRRVQSAATTDAGEGAMFDPQDLESDVWDIFDPEGRYRGALTLPPHLSVYRLTGARLYAVQRDEMGVQSVVRYGVGDGSDES